MRNKRLFERIVRKSQKELKEWLAITLKEYGYTKQINKDGYLYLPGEIPVMLIAHMDTVHTNNVKTVCWSKDYDTVMSPEGIGGDDRSGVYMILRIVKDLKCHILFCEDEEKGCIGATKFTKSGLKPLVNYLVEFDRVGQNDAVFYNCDNKEFTKMVLSYGFEEEYGSFSDISTIAPYLKLAAVNISSGYYNAHTKHEYVVMGIMNRNADRVARMITETHGTKYEYVHGYRSYGGYHSFGGGWRSYYSGRGYGSLYGGYDDDGFYYGSTKGEDDEDNDSVYQNDRTTPMRLSPLDRIGGKWVCSTATNIWEIGKDTAGEYALSRQGDLYIRQYENTWSYLETPFEVLDSTGNAIHFSINDYIWAKVDDAPEAEEEQTENLWPRDLMGEEREVVT